MDRTDRNIWMNVPLQERQRYMTEQMHVHHPAFVRAAQEVKRRMHRCINEDKGAALLLLAPSGAGKSHFCRFLKRRWPDHHEETITKIPVVHFSIPQSPNARSMGQALLASIQDPKWNRGTALENFKRLTGLLRDIGTEVILIDNVHDIPEKRTKAGMLQLGNWIRDLIEESGRLVVLLGTQSALEVVQTNSQLRRRTAKHIHMNYLEYSKEFGRFRRFLAELDKLLPLAKSSNLDEADIAKRIGWATNGIPDYIFQLLLEAVGVAVQAGREKIEREHLEKAFSLMFMDAAIDINPFSSNNPDRPLINPGEPFHEWFDESNPDPNINPMPRTKRNTSNEN